jgi:hypothetical protein
VKFTVENWNDFRTRSALSVEERRFNSLHELRTNHANEYHLLLRCNNNKSTSRDRSKICGRFRNGLVTHTFNYLLLYVVRTTCDPDRLQRRSVAHAVNAHYRASATSLVTNQLLRFRRRLKPICCWHRAGQRPYFLSSRAIANTFDRKRAKRPAPLARRRRGAPLQQMAYAATRLEQMR